MVDPLPGLGITVRLVVSHSESGGRGSRPPVGWDLEGLHGGSARVGGVRRHQASRLFREGAWLLREARTSR